MGRIVLRTYTVRELELTPEDFRKIKEPARADPLRDPGTHSRNRRRTCCGSVKS